MKEEIKILIESLRRGEYEDPAEKISLLVAALQEHHADSALLLSLLRAPQIPLRLAGIGACKGAKDSEVIAELIRFVDDPEVRVRAKLCETLGSIPGEATLKGLRKLIQDSHVEVRASALRGAANRSELVEQFLSCLANDRGWGVRLEAVGALGRQKSPKIPGAILTALANEDDEDVQQRCAEVLETHFDANPKGVEKQMPTDVGLLVRAKRRISGLGGNRFPKLIAWITVHTNVAVDPKELARFGTDLTALAEAGTLPRSYAVEESRQSLIKLLQREPWRSIALLGPAGSGKSALVNALVYELAKPENGCWRVLRVSPQDFMAGTHFSGEWETKVKALVDTVRKPRRVLVYVPNLADLSSAGTWSRSDSSVATALAPYLEDGSVLLLGESAPEQFERGLGRIPSLQRVFDRVLVHEATVETTRSILGWVRDEKKFPMDDLVLDRLLEVSGQFLTHVCRPGNAVSLLRGMEETARESTEELTFRDVLAALSKSTGIPTDLLDDAIPLNSTAVRLFFETRIIGQSEGVDAVADLVTLIKAGLTDPNKPFAVFLFVGPTGVGKTELARALAEFIFGDAARLLRFDMSEFANYGGFEKLIGTPKENGVLTNAVRQHPFSVVLFDEIEKAHVNVYDLCLQIFDAGRLTDGHGRTVDFRRTIVILTSNIGATAPTTQLGFGGESGPALPEADKDRTFRELSHCFRPEFLNRIDRIVQFRPLTLEVAEQIARREVELVLQRSGIRRRNLTVEVSPAVVALMVRQGYSPHFGARPLKRTVERLLLLPMARAIASGAIPENSILHLNLREGSIEIETTRPVKANAPAVPKPQPAHESLPVAVDELRKKWDALQAEVTPLSERKSELLQVTQQPGFYQDTARRTVTYDEIHKLDQFLVRMKGVGKALEGIEAKLAQGSPAKLEDPALRERLETLTSEIDQIAFIARSRNGRDLSDALISICIVDSAGQPQNGVEKLVAMYQGFAARKRMSAEVLGEFFEGKKDCVYLHVAGLGAYSILKEESGLHQLDRRYKSKAQRTGRELMMDDREVVRVDVVPIYGEPDEAFRRAVKAKSATLKPVRNRLIKSDTNVSLFHEASLNSLNLWTAGPRSQAIDRALLVFCGLVSENLPKDEIRPNSVVRRYQLGLASGVKDTRTGRSTTNVDRVLKGNLDAILPAG